MEPNKVLIKLTKLINQVNYICKAESGCLNKKNSAWISVKSNTVQEHDRVYLACKEESFDQCEEPFNCLTIFTLLRMALFWQLLTSVFHASLEKYPLNG